MKHNWEYKPLGDCFCYIKNGANIRQSKDAGGYPITRIETLSNGIFNRDKVGYADITDISKYKSYVLADGDLLMSHINSKSYVGRTVKYSAKPNEIFIHGMNLLRLIPHEWINPQYFHYLTKDYYFKSKIANIRKDAVNQSSFSISDLRKIPIPVPPLDMQERIVAELDDINAMIEAKREQLKQLDLLAQSVFYTMFGDPVTNPKGWEESKLIECIVYGSSISYGIVQPGDDFPNGVPVVRPIDLTGGKYVKRDCLKIVDPAISESYKRTILFGNEILMCVRGTTGVIRMADTSLKDANVTRGITPLRIKDTINVTYMYEYLKQQKAQEFIKYYTKGTTLKQINMTDLRNLPVHLPPLDLQNQFATKVEAIEAQKAKVEATIAELQTLLDSRMDYWFN